jgi:manganese transport protein
LYGESGTGQLLVLSQVVLSLQLSFAVVPLLMFTQQRSFADGCIHQSRVGQGGWRVHRDGDRAA